MPDALSPSSLLDLGEDAPASPPSDRPSSRIAAPPTLDARVERALATASGHILVFGWAADEGCDVLRPTFTAGDDASADGSLQPSTACLLRHSRADVETVQGGPTHDFGYLFLAKTAAHPPPRYLELAAADRKCMLDLKPERVSERRFLEDLLAFFGFFHAHDGREAVLARFLLGGGRALIGELVSRGQSQAAKVQQLERFGQSRGGPSFMTVLFGSVEAAMFQPLLFAKGGVAFGEWIYVCNSPELAEDLLRMARTASKLHDLPVRVVVLNGNAGFGGANNVALGTAASGDIVLVNPDVHPIPAWADRLNRAIRTERFGKTLRGGLLFYDEEMLMHGGMYLDEDVFIGRYRGDAGGTAGRLMRVEHYDKGVPFVPEDWTAVRPVPAVTGAVMAFDRNAFETLGGFSSDFAYGHYEDADLCLRWAEEIGPVVVDPDIRLVHLEGQGSKTRLPHFHGAAIVNRHVFEARNRHRARAGSDPV